MRRAVAETSALRDVDALAARAAELRRASGASLARDLQAQQDAGRTLLSRLAEELGEVTDLVVLRGRIAGEGRSSRAARKLAKRLDHKAARGARRALRRSKPFFSQRAKSFARRVTQSGGV